jgi:hypothetical protein
MEIDLFDGRNIQHIVDYRLLTYELLDEKYELWLIAVEEEKFWERFIKYCHTGK